MAAFHPPFQVEDQTDEDFFDKLVDDEFGVSGSGSGDQSVAVGDAGMTRAFSNLSIDDKGDVLEGLESEKDVLATAKEGTTPDLAGSDGVAAVAAEPVSRVSTDSDSGRSSGGSKVTSVKEVQWSALAVDLVKSDLRESGSYSDFLMELQDGPSDVVGELGDSKPTAEIDLATSFVENPVVDSTASLVSSENQDTQVHESVGDGTVDEKDLNYWENMYPGWRYDASTGQWHQLGYYNAPVESTQVGLQEAVQSAGKSADQRSDVSYLQQTAQSVVETVSSEEYQVSQGAVDYPSNMVFDPQYPGWYYDMNTQQWNSLESYNQSVQMTSSVVQDQQVQDVNATTPEDFLSDPNQNNYGQVGQSDLDQSHYSQFGQSDLNQSHYSQVGQSDLNQSHYGQFGQSDLNQSHYGQVGHSDLDQSHYGQVGQSDLNQSHYGRVGQSDLNQSRYCRVGHSDLNQSRYSQVDNYETHSSQVAGSRGSSGDWDGSVSSYGQMSVWQPEPGANQQTRSFYGSMGQSNSYVEQQAGFSAVEPFHEKKNLDGGINNFMGYRSFNPVESTHQYNNQVKSDQQAQFSNHFQQPFQHKGPSFSQYPFSPNEGRSSAGRPPHALVSFGFGGKLIVMKDTSSFSSYGSQDTSGGTVSILNLMEVLSNKADAVAMGSEGSEYISALCHQSFPGPLVGGNASNKDVNKWMDERIANCNSVTMDFRKGESLRLLLSLLKISFQHYGKLRSPFGSDRSVQEVDGPELAITKLLESTRKDDAHLREFGAFTHCMHNLPPEGQIRKTAVEVQTLLVSGKRREALRYAQDGQLWGPALALASQLGREFYVDTVKQMALKQLVSGSPLQTLCLLIAEQPVNSTSGVLSDAMNTSQQSQIIASGMLDDWEKNLAIITANRTVGDEAVITRLGYSLWRERGEIAAAHTCFLVAEALFEPYSDKAMMCLIGADHLRYPRTYANSAAIQRTELYEYTKVLGNSQYTLQPFQPYKLIYAYMLAEVGKLSDSLKYCQSILKSLKNFNRSPEIEPLKQLSSALEERLRTHQQGDYGTNLAPAKLVGKLFTSIDKSIHRMMGTPLPPSTQSTSLSNGQLDEHYGNSVAPKVANSQSTMTMSLLAPSASMEPISEWTTDSSRRSVHNRSVSEPDFGSYPKQSQDPSKEAASADAQGKSSGPSRFGRIGSQLFQKTIGWVARSRSDHQAKLGETNKFYYDEKLKRWVEEGVEPQAAEAALPPPPTTASFMNGTSEYNINSVFKSQSILSNGEPEMKNVPLSEHSSGMPPIPPSSNQFSARSRMGVRSRYVDTFNKGGAAPTPNLFHSTPAPAPKPLGNANFFVPTPVSSTENILESPGQTLQEVSYTEAPSTSFVETAFSPPPALSSSSSMQQFPSMDNIVQTGNRGMETLQNGNRSISSRSRATSWSSGSFPNAFNPQIANIKPIGDMLDTRQPTNMTLAMNGGGSGFGDELQEVEL
ncbi:hypothetical protein QJS10_CPA10g00887 [Acorus calamus]|uniref:Protein transport protein sec16 n=1 Tax=Acorus calamus TaxID=4465 RepID=A0AAV9DZ79_ACOCL|nr:hypothetical protein QJS10_CPA10g00887 [Acorus calamus]